MAKYILSLIFIFLFLFFFVSIVNAQTCGGTRVCQQTSWVCTPDGLGCTATGVPNPLCVCGNQTQNYTVACSGIPPSFTCSGEPCLAGDTVVSDNCSVTPAICGGGPVSYCNGGASSYYCCGSSQVCIPDSPTDTNFSCCPSSSPYLCNGVCSSTPPSPKGANYKTYCSGSNLRESYDSGVCTTIDNFVQTCANGCVTDSSTTAHCAPPPVGATSTPTPTPPPGATPTPTIPFVPTSTPIPAAPAPIRGTVYYDTNNSRVIDTGDARASGVTVTGTNSPTVTTRSDGTYAVQPPSTAAVTIQAQLAGYISSPASQTAASGDVNVDFLLFRPAISGLVYIDYNQNGVYDSASSTMWCKNGAWDKCFASQPTLPKWFNLPQPSCGRRSCATVYCYDTNGNGTCGSGETQTNDLPLSPATWLWYKYPEVYSFTLGMYCIDANGSGTCGSGETIYYSPPASLLDSSYIRTAFPADKPYSGAALLASASWPNGSPRTYSGTASSNASGAYSFLNLPRTGTYSINLTMPQGYRASSGDTTPSNPKSVVITTADGTANFPLFIAPPTCSSISQFPVSGSVNLTASCTGDPTYTWTTTCGTVVGAVPSTVNTAVYTAPANSCASPTCTVTVTATNISGTATSNTSITNAGTNKVTGIVYADVASNSCTTKSPMQGLSMQLWNENAPATQISSTTTNASGAYTLPNTTTTNNCTNRHIILGAEGFLTKGVWPDGGSFTQTGVTLNDYGPISFPPDHTVDFCVGVVSPWFQVDSGDVRFPNLINEAPSGKTVATGSTPGIMYSSTFLAQLGQDSTTSRVNNEYSFANNYSTARGTASYEFYLSRAKQLNVPINELCSTSCTVTGSQVTNATGIQRVFGDLTISDNGNLPASKHLILLVDGNVTIQKDIFVPGNGGRRLFIMAAKGNITVGSDVTQLDGIYTSEGSITLKTAADCLAAIPDTQLTVNGALVANALYPFATNGSGKITNSRTLCSGDLSTPSVKVMSRLDFATEMTDFYKFTNKTFREVQP